MKFRLHGFLPTVMAIAIAIVVFTASAYGQFVVNLTVSPTPSPTPFTAPAGPLTVTATITNSPLQIERVVFYRNDVPYKTDTTNASWSITEADLGQDTYTYRARAYDTDGVWADSNEVKIIVNTPFAFKMGQLIPAYDGKPAHQTHGPDRDQDHTDDINKAIAYINYVTGNDGGTLFFPCVPPAPPLPADEQSIYNIRDTIPIPSNITLQGERAEETSGRCRIYWRDVAWNPPSEPEPSTNCFDNPGNLLDKPMFKIAGGKTGVRFRDMWLYSRSSGPNCSHPRPDIARIAVEKTVAIGIYGGNGSIRDVILENVAITAFTYGVLATTRTCPYRDNPNCTETNYELTDIKMRGVRPNLNFRQLYIDARYAYDWDVQNFNISSMGSGQAGVHIVESGKPSIPVSENTKLKFLQLNCNGNLPNRSAAFCTKVEKHGGLYFKQLHHEGVKNAIIVEDMGEFIMNEEPIVLEGSVATGEFYDASMKLYLIGNAVIAAPDWDQAQLDPDKGRLEFIDNGVQSLLVDCGDIHWDRTDVDLSDGPEWDDFQMQFTHTERNRAAFFARIYDIPVYKSHTPCPYDVDGATDISDVGGEFFDTGVLPTEVFYYEDPEDPESREPVYTHIFENSGTCPVSNPCDIAATLNNLFFETITPPPPTSPYIVTRRGSVYINGTFKISTTVTIPAGMQIIGGPLGELQYTGSSSSLFKIDAPVGTNLLPRTSAIVIRNLPLIKIGTPANNAIEIIGHTIPGPNNTTIVGSLSDVHLSGLTIEGFAKGLAADPTDKNPMLDGVSMKNMTFVNNSTAAIEMRSDNASNWNVQNLVMQSIAENAVGWKQSMGGNSLQGVNCRGTEEHAMKDCISLSAAHSFLNGLKPPEHVTNAVTIEQAPFLYDETIYESRMFSSLLIRNSDLRSSDDDPSNMNLLGKAFITSMNNQYENFDVATESFSLTDPGYEADLSRVTHCGDSYGTAGAYPGLDDLHLNNWVGTPTPTRVKCGKRPFAWDDVVQWGGYYNELLDLKDVPLVGNFYTERDDFVIYRPDSSDFLIRRADGLVSNTVHWGLLGDKPVVGRFLSSTSTSQIVAFRNGVWWVKDPNDSNPNNYYSWSWGTTGDIPFAGNFIEESGGASAQRDEIAVYRPSNGTVWILDPRPNGTSRSFQMNSSHGEKIQVGDFMGLGHDQVAQFDDGDWYIVDADPTIPVYDTAELGEAGDIPVAGKYLEGVCTQLGVWRPDTQEFIVEDPPFSNCDTRTDVRLVWGLKVGSSGDPDIPLTVSDEDGELARPTVYRPMKGVFPYSIANGQWWVHDLIEP